jgi:lysyl-tRNA synthetase class II
MASLTDSSYSNAELALDKLVANNPSNDYHKYLEPLKNELGHNHNIRTKWLEYAITYQVYSTSDKTMDLTPQYTQQLVDYTSNKYEFRTRIAAMGSAKRAGVFNEILVANLMDAASGTNGRLASPAVEVLKYFAEDKTKVETLKAIYNQMSDDAKKYLKNYGISY